MKYCTLEADYPNILISENNFRTALIRIGELDPYNIKVTNFKCRYLSKRKRNEMNAQDYLNRGVLNVRFRLNRSKGQSGKFTNRMIRFTSLVQKKHDKYRVKLPQKDYIKITMAVYLILWQYDRLLCEKLFQKTMLDGIPQERQIALNTISPVQTDIVFNCNSPNPGVQEFLDYTRMVALN